MVTLYKKQKKYFNVVNKISLKNIFDNLKTFLIKISLQKSPFKVTINNHFNKLQLNKLETPSMNYDHNYMSALPQKNYDSLPEILSQTQNGETMPIEELTILYRCKSMFTLCCIYAIMLFCGIKFLMFIFTYPIVRHLENPSSGAEICLFICLLVIYFLLIWSCIYMNSVFYSVFAMGIGVFMMVFFTNELYSTSDNR